MKVRAPLFPSDILNFASPNVRQLCTIQIKRETLRGCGGGIGKSGGREGKREGGKKEESNETKWRFRDHYLINTRLPICGLFHKFHKAFTRLTWVTITCYSNWVLHVSLKRAQPTFKKNNWARKLWFSIVYFNCIHSHKKPNWISKTSTRGLSWPPRAKKIMAGGKVCSRKGSKKKTGILRKWEWGKSVVDCRTGEGQWEPQRVHYSQLSLAPLSSLPSHSDGTFSYCEVVVENGSDKVPGRQVFSLKKRSQPTDYYIAASH